MARSATVIAAALGGHMLHVVVIGGALLVAAAVYAIATVTAPSEATGDTDTRPAGRAARSEPEAPRAGYRRARRARPAIAQQLAFLGLCAAAGAHLAVMPDHFQQSWMYGAFFAVAGALQLALGWSVLVRPRPAELRAALTFSRAVVVLWAVSRFVGVPLGPDNGRTEELGVLDLFATGSELLTAGALAYLLRGVRPMRPDTTAPAWRWSLWSPAMRVMMAATVVTVPLLSALASRS